MAIEYLYTGMLYILILRAYDEIMTLTQIKIGTRGSPLALAQANQVRNLLIKNNPQIPEPVIKAIKTTGDKITDRHLADLGGKGLFTKEIQIALIEGKIDVAVHSMKDVESILPKELIIDCYLPREDPRDVLIGAPSIDALLEGARVGTASLRRRAQLLAIRPDLKILLLRGNVETRLDKLASGEVDATILALAGLKRLKRTDVVGTVLEPDLFLPSVGQGAIGVERRTSDLNIGKLLNSINHDKTEKCVVCERSMLAALDGTCRTPVGGLATLKGDKISLEGMLVWPDGTGIERLTRVGNKKEAHALGHSVGIELRNLAGPDFFESLL
ncbi:MAG: Porphobilinogen deaminase [Alphaproteobacteria bacterium MarineAlpha12_Bin1]|nr:MAG: Porphobilinogen deaminase [Alphaproteobacteria bacterium MarineAlpha12_Bin1]